MTGQTIILSTKAHHLDHATSKACGACGGKFYRDKRNTWAYWAKARFCSRECFGAFNAARMVAERPARDVAFRKWFSEGAGCWEWAGAIDRDGYGIFTYAGKTARAARIALELDGRDPGEGYACHHCDNPRCVRPSHLYPGTPTENVADMIERGRGTWRQRSSTKLTESAVREIRASSATNTELAGRFGVSSSNITMVRRGKTWRNIT